MPDYRRQLQNLLRELFQFDAADLDFGIYAVMNRKRDQVERFIEHDLLDVIRDGLQLQSAAQRHQAETDFAAARQKLIDAAGDALDGEQVKPEYRQLPLYALPAIKHAVDEYDAVKAVRDEATLSADLEAQTYNDLYRFFARYYDDGDFISQRRYGAESKYAIPYNGEEVTLYWANFDQYYVKTGEYFTDYRFAVEPSIGFERATVHFKLRTASVEQNNVKGEKRFFLLAAAEPVMWDAENRTLTVGFEYRPLTDGEKLRYGTRDQQDKLLAEAEPAILNATPDAVLRDRLAQTTGEPGKEKSLLARQLTRYAARNIRDYFIHKDLKTFLTRELDFFLKNEVLRLEDLDFDRPAAMQPVAARLKTIRLIAGRIISFLAQIEDFQRRLWEKRKFVVQSDHCVTLDRVPPELYAEIAANDRQRAEWRKLYGLEVTSNADLSQHPFAMVDTAFYDVDFKARLLASFADLDAACDGLLVHGENYSALRLLIPRFEKQVRCVYIDPPYNATATEILYKNEYKHSSWLALMYDRLLSTSQLLADTGILCVTIDDYELHRLRSLVETVMQDDNYLATVSIRNNPSGRSTVKGFSINHEYALFYAKSASAAIVGRLPHTEDQRNRYDSTSEDGKPFEWENFRKNSTASYRNDRPRQYFPVYYDRNTGVLRIPDMNWRETTREWTIQQQPDEGEVAVWPRDDSGQDRVWRWGVERTMKAMTELTARESDGRTEIYKRKYIHPEGSLPRTWWDSPAYSARDNGTRSLTELFGPQRVFDFPKSIEAVKDCIKVASASPEAVILDYFAGSGTTGHAVMELNQESDEDRHYILVEIGDHFDTALKPRIQKVAYAADWRDGKPVAGSAGQSHMFQYIRLESYEDSLNNIRFRELSGPLLAVLEKLPDYTLHYMLDFETQGSPSLLDPAQFERPFDYTLDITRDGVTQPRAVDLVATFNFLLGLRVRTLRRFERNGAPIVRVIGADATGRRICVLWRDAPPLDEMEAEKAWLLAHVLKDAEYDVLYINGESALAALPIEPEFRRLMFEGVR